MYTPSPADQPTSNESSLLLQGITAATCSRVIFAFFDDPEGPNLVVVTGLAIIIFTASLVLFFSGVFPALVGRRRTLATIPIQITLATLIYLALR